MEIAFCLDNNYVPHCATVIMSIITNNREENISFHILSNDMSEANKQMLLHWIDNFSNKQIFIYDIDIKHLTHLPIGESYINISTYFRLLLPDYLKNLGKVIYLDCDVIVNGNLKELWNIDISQYAIAGVRDRINDYIRVYNRLEYNMQYGYINAGVLLINLNIWRQNKVFEQAFEIAKRMPLQLKNHDQDILNLLFHQNKLIIDFKYNLLEYFLYSEDYLFLSKKYYHKIEMAIKKPLIIHFCMPHKPWHKECINPFRDQYIQYRKATPWADFKINKYCKKDFKEQIVQFTKLIAISIGLIPKSTKRSPLRTDIYKITSKNNVIF